MATLADLRVLFDVPEPRVLRDRLLIACEGQFWDKRLGDGNVWIDPVTNTAFLTPAPVSPLWNTDATGNRARLGKSDYELATPGDWLEVHRRVTGDIFLEGGKGARVRTSQVYNADQPMFLSCYIPGVESLAEQTVIKFGWGEETADPNNLGVWCRLRANGSFLVYVGDQQVGDYSVSGGVHDPLKDNKTGGSESIAQKTISLLLMPCNRRCLLVVTSWGKGFEHTFSDLPFDNQNSIVPSGKFWWQVPTGYGSVQCAPLKFATSGTIYGPLSQFRYAPHAGQAWIQNPYWSEAGPSTLPDSAVAVSLVDVDGNAFVANDVRNQARLKVTLTGNGSTSPGVYAVDMHTDPELTTTADATVDVTQLISSLSISVPEQGGTSLTLSGYDPQAWSDLGVEAPQIQSDRPFAIRVGGIDIVRGTLAAPTRTFGLGKADQFGDLLKWEGADRWGNMALHQLNSAVPYDEFTLTEAVQDLMKCAGIPADSVYIYADPYTLPSAPAASAIKWKLLPDFGDTVAQWIDKLAEDYAADWFRGWVPTLLGYAFYFRPPSDLDPTPVLDLFHSFDDAIAAGVPYERVASRLVRTWDLTKKAPEVNQINVIGVDPATQQRIFAIYNDAASQAPGTLPQDRPDNWRGQVVPLMYIEPAITTQEAADRALESLVQRLTDRRVFAKWNGDFLMRHSDGRPLWKSDVVRVHDKGRVAWQDYRIIAIPTIDLVRKWNEAQRFGQTVLAHFSMDCQYVAERIADGTGQGLAG